MSTNQQVDPAMLEGELPPPPGREAPRQSGAQADGDSSPWDELSEEDRAWVENKRVKSPAELAKQYRELEQARGRESQELSELRRFQREQLERQQQAEQRALAEQQQQSQQQGLDWRVVADQCIDPQTGETDMGAFGATFFQITGTASVQASGHYTDQRIADLEARLEERLGPLAERDLESQAADVMSEYDEELWEDLAAEADALQEEDEGIADRIGLEALFERAYGRIQRRAAEQRRREADGFTLTRGGRRSERPTTPVDRELALLDHGHQNMRKRDGL
jgi:hypothetical protein